VTITVQITGREKGLTGRYQGLDDHGALLLETAAGPMRLFAGDVLSDAAAGGG
jgi:hypothetical protein